MNNSAPEPGAQRPAIVEKGSVGTVSWVISPGMTWGRTVVLGAILLVLLSLILAVRVYPPAQFPRTLDLSISFPRAFVGQTEPLITAGAQKAADFLTVDYPAEGFFRFGYDYWGKGGPKSDPIPYQPGQAYRVHIEMAALGATGEPALPAVAPLLVTFEGREVLYADLRFHYRKPTNLFFGIDPIGGSTAGVEFRGKIRTLEGRTLRGDVRSYYSWIRRGRTWLATRPWEMFFVLISSAIGAVALPWIARWGLAQTRNLRISIPGRRRPDRTFIVAAAVCLIVFLWLITQGTSAIVGAETFTDFYDQQARSLLHGRLDVPESAIGDEAFVFGGKYYGYFGPTPSLLRLPLVVTGIGFGKVSRLFMAFEFLGSLVAAYSILCVATRVVGGESASPSRWATAVFVIATGLGSTLLFLGSRAYVYHEAILCGIAFALWSIYCSLKFWESPSSRWWLGALACGTLSVQARPPTGLFALTALAAIALAQALRRRNLECEAVPATRRAPWWRAALIAGFALAGVASFNAVSYLKFRTIEGCPLRYNVSYKPDRLAKIDARQFHLANIPFGMDAYLLKPTLGRSAQFPFFYANGLNSMNYTGPKIDMTEPMAGLPYAMPVVFACAIIAVLGAILGAGPGRFPVGLLTLAAIPVTVAMFAAVCVSHRYTGDFIPVLLPLAAFGLVAMDRGERRWHALTRTVLTAAALASVVVTLGLSLRFQGEIVWGVPTESKQRYEKLRQRFERPASEVPSHKS
jgi:hypothetical protein